MNRATAKKLVDSGILVAFANGGKMEYFDKAQHKWYETVSPDFRSVLVGKYRVRKEDDISTIPFAEACKMVGDGAVVIHHTGDQYDVVGISRQNRFSNTYRLTIKGPDGREFLISGYDLQRYQCDTHRTKVITPQYIEVDLTDV